MQTEQAQGQEGTHSWGNLQTSLLRRQLDAHLFCRIAVLPHLSSSSSLSSSVLEPQQIKAQTCWEDACHKWSDAWQPQLHRDKRPGWRLSLACEGAVSGGRDPRYYQIVQFSTWEVVGWNDGELICFPCFCQTEVVSEDEKLEPTQGVSCWGCISQPTAVEATGAGRRDEPA